MTSAALVYYSYLGFDMITTLSDEAKRPVIDVPRAVSDSNIICSCVYFVVSFSLVGMTRMEKLNPETALAEAFTTAGMYWVTKLLYFCGCMGISAACFSNHIVSFHLLNFRPNLGCLFRLPKMG
jgi:basic amino acid/polyamine antiporter, APA family